VRGLVIAGLIGAIVCSLVACFSTPGFKNGSLLCSTDPKRPCPDGYECREMHCWLITADGGSDGAPSD
jgi:hypothetical protein